MPTNALNGTLGDPAHFAGDFLFKDAALPNNTTIYSDEHTLNNALGRLQLTGTIDTNLSIAADKSLSVTLQSKTGETWNDYNIVTLKEGETTIPVGELFAHIPVPSETQRLYRLKVTTDFNASAVKLTTAIEIVPG